MSSLRTRLFALLAALALLAAVAVGGATYASVRAEADQLFDYQLRQMALSLRDQGRIGAPEREALAQPELDFVVQIWTLDGLAVYSSQPAPPLPARAVLGHTTVQAGGEPWRVYSTTTPLSVVQVAQPLRVRTELARQAAWRSLRPVMVATPLAALALWWVLGWSLAPLRPVQRALDQRSAADLTPLPLTGLPDEVRPLVQGFNQLLARLDQSFGHQRAFVADAAHELRTPLTALKLQLGLLRGAADEADRQQALARLQAGVDRATRLVEQLLALARSEPGGPSPQASEAVDLAEVVRQALRDAEPLAQRSGGQLRADLAEGLPRLTGDREALRGAVRNLIDNALLHGRPPDRPPQVQLSLARDGAALRLWVDDAGPGVAAEQRETLFQRFHRLNPGQGPGSGLGLAIVHATVQRHGGTVTLHDAPDGGLRVELRLPLPAAVAGTDSKG